MGVASALIVGIVLGNPCPAAGTELCESVVQTAATDAQPRSALWLSGDWLHLDEGSDGGEFRADWIYRGGDAVVQAGFSRYWLDDSRWSVGRFGVYRKFHPRAALSAEIQAGPGRAGGEDFTYQKYRLGLTLFGAPRFLVFIDDQYLKIAGVTANLITTGAQLQRGPWTFQGAFIAGAGGSTRTGFGYGRIDRQLGPVRLFGGAGAGRASPEVFDLAANGVSDDVRQVFGGAAFRRGKWELVLSFDLLDQAAVDRFTTSAAMQIPLW